jgi:hypothetical protein
MKQILTIFLLMYACLFIAQNKLTGNKNYYVSFVPSYGFMVEHRSSIGALVRGYTPAYELNFIKPTSGSKKWHLENNYPELGLSLGMIDFANPKQLGYCFSLAPFVEIPLNKKEKPSRLIMRASWGLSYLTKRFDIESNHKNIAIGSHWNAFVQLRWLWHLNINEQLRLEPGFTFSHASNGRAQVPNLGLNVFLFNLGLTYKFKNDPIQKTAKDSSYSTWPSKHEILVWDAIGFNEHEPPGGPKYFANTFSINYYYNLRNTHKWGAGFDIAYDTQNAYHMETSGNPAQHWTDILQLGIKGCYAYNVGRISFPIEMGYYAISKPKEDGPIFHRLGVRYFCENGLMFNFSMKSHWAIASHFDYGIGYVFNIKKKKKHEE